MGYVILFNLIQIFLLNGTQSKTGRRLKVRCFIQEDLPLDHWLDPLIPLSWGSHISLCATIQLFFFRLSLVFRFDLLSQQKKRHLYFLSEPGMHQNFRVDILLILRWQILL